MQRPQRASARTNDAEARKAWRILGEPGDPVMGQRGACRRCCRAGRRIAPSRQTGTGTTSIAITLSATASATYQCYNKAGNKPEGVPKSFGPTALATPPTPFPVSHGQTTASLSLGPLGPGTFSCPSGQV